MTAHGAAIGKLGNHLRKTHRDVAGTPAVTAAMAECPECRRLNAVIDETRVVFRAELAERRRQMDAWLAQRPMPEVA